MERFLDGDDFGGGTCYNLSKAGLMVYTMQLAVQYPNIKVRIKLKIVLSVYGTYSFQSSHASRYPVSIQDSSGQTCQRVLVPQNCLKRGQCQQ